MAGTAEDADLGAQALAEGEVVQLVQLVPGERVARHRGDLLAVAVPPVVHVAAAAGLPVDHPEVDPLAGEQWFQDLPDLAAEPRAEHHVHAQTLDHPSLPHSLPAGMQMDLGLVGGLVDGDRQLGIRGKDHDMSAHAR
ncbi:hypothetical protein GCM10027615_75530 [Plantactinospora veratri]